MEALAQIGDHDDIGKFSASYITDGIIKVAIGDGPAAGIEAKNHVLKALHEDPGENYTSCMEFKDIRVARDLFDGNINAVASIGQGKVRIRGMISQVDNVNRILDRVALYLT